MTVASAASLLSTAALAAALLALAGPATAQSPPAPGEAAALPSPEAELEARQRQEALARERAEQAARRKARLEKAARDKAEAEKADAVRREKALLAPPVAPPPVAPVCQGSVQRSGTVIEIGLNEPCVDLAGIGAIAFRSGGAPIVTLALPSADDRIGELSTLIKSTPGLAREPEPAGRFGMAGLDRWLGWGAALVGWLLFGLSLGTQVARRRSRPADKGVVSPAAVTAPLSAVPERPSPVVPFARSSTALPSLTLAAVTPARSAPAASPAAAGWGDSRCPGPGFLAEYNAVLADPGRLDGFIAAHGFVAVSGDSAAGLRIDAGRSAKDSPLWGIVAGDDLWVMPGWYLYHKRANLTGINFSAAQTRYGYLFELRQGPGFDLQRPARLRRAAPAQHVVTAPGLLVLG